MAHKNLLRVLTLVGLVLSLAGPMGAVPVQAAPMQADVINFTGEELLGKPTDTSITINIVPDATIEYYYEYGTSQGGPYTDETSPTTATATTDHQPHEVVISGLGPNTRYYYRMLYHAPGDPMDDWVTRDEHTFHTQRAKGSTFTFTIIADTHAEYTDAEYQQAIQNIIADQPDFHLDLGDTFMTDSDGSQSQVNDAYLASRNPSYMGGIGYSAPIFVMPGNHENEEGWNLDDEPFSPALASIQARKLYYPTPITDGFYSGNQDPLAAIDAATYGDQLREDYYAWEWGDALFVVFDPFQYTMENPYGNTGGEGRVGEYDPATGDRWNWTLGQQQFDWLKDVLETSTAKYKFVFAHHMVGGSANYVRGGAVPAHMFEWGGYNADGTTWGFSTKRPGWGDDPIHQLMIDNSVSAFFHGHDHQYAYEVRDGIVYQCLPKPSPGLDFHYYSESDPYTERVIGNSGHIRVTVTPEEATVEYVRSNITAVSHSYTIEPSSDNTPPEAADDSAVTDEDTAVAVYVLSNDSDADGDSLTVSSVTQPTNGSVTNNTTDVTYTPDADYCGSDSFSYVVSDGNGGSDTATVDVSVTCVNDAPVADDQAVSTMENTPVDIALTASDVDGDPLTYSVVDSPTNGDLTGDGATRTYTPNAGYIGADSFTFRVNDGQEDSDIATVTIEVTEVNTPPVADDQAVSTDEDTPVDITLTGSDEDGDPLTFEVVDGPTNGVLSGSGANLTYTPDADYNGPDSFTFRANDGQADSGVATVSITVDPVNDPPVADDQDVSTTEDTPVDVTLTGSDVDGDPLTFEIVDGPTNGVLSGSGATRTYTPNAGYTGTDGFTFRANDGQADSNVATVTISVTSEPTGVLEFGAVTVGGDDVTVNLDNTYLSPVVVCSVQYDDSTTPVVVRVSNVTATSFDVRLQNPSGGSVTAERVSYLVVEEGTWTIDGVNVEAQTYLSTVTDEDGSWVGEPQSYGQSYTNPVVLGQVMSDNDPDWSVFWCQGRRQKDSPSATALTTGKMVGEDTDTTRADETIGFIVFEAGHGTIGGVEYEASVGPDSVRGVDDSPPYAYTFNTTFAAAPQVALTTLAGMDGADGGWAQTHGSTLATATSLYLSIDEDQVGDSERNHTTEQVAYVAFAPSDSTPLLSAPTTERRTATSPRGASPWTP